MILIRELKAARDRLARINPADAARTALAAAADSMAEQVQVSLSHPPGSDHATPWRRSSVLHDSISVAKDGDKTILGSTDPVAVDQEVGTRTIPPRPFLAPTAAAQSAAIAETVSAAILEDLERLR